MLLKSPPQPSVAYRVFRRVRHSAQSVSDRNQRQRVAKLLADPRPPDPSLSEAEFARLQSIYGPRPPYGYDPLSIWNRAAERASTILSLPGMEEPGRRVCDAGAGEGMLGLLLSTYGHNVTLADMDDWRDDRAKHLELLRINLDDPTSLPESRFDLICSFNTMEHVLDPAAAVAGIRRSLRPGGLAYFDFGPLYASPWGMHAYGTLRMPFPQYLFGESLIASALDDLGIRDLGGQRCELQPMNRWRLKQFQALWQNNPQWECIEEAPRRVHEHLDLVETYPAAFRGRGLNVDDLIVSNLAVLLRRRETE